MVWLYRNCVQLLVILMLILILTFVFSVPLCLCGSRLGSLAGRTAPRLLKCKRDRFRRQCGAATMPVNTITKRNRHPAAAVAWFTVLVLATTLSVVAEDSPVTTAPLRLRLEPAMPEPIRARRQFETL